MFRIQHDKILTPGDGSITFWGLADKNAESIKSLEAVKVCWIEEARMLTKRSLELLRPTIRAEGSEIWATCNPTRKSDAIDVFHGRRNRTMPSWLRPLEAYSVLPWCAE
jgi:phage terminase large subunit